MGIDIDTYRQRVGGFRGGHGCNILYLPSTCYLNCGDVAYGVLYVGAVWLFTALIVLTGLEMNPWSPADFMDADTCIVKACVCSQHVSTLGATVSSIMSVIGAVGFVKTLLRMAGIESNPGPTDMFNFRYQYLLVELGTGLLRKTLNEQLVIIGTQLDQHLMNKINTIKTLVNKNVITGTQEALLPPKCTNPVLSSFDITLLTCILRNMCGLKKSSNTVWTNPALNDLSLEADIARLRLCRNKLGHSGTVLIPGAQFDADWKELSQIMLSLNSKLKSGVANLQGIIDQAETMEIDENLKKLNEETLRLWEESDKAWEHGQAEILETLQKIEQNQCMLSDRLEKDNGKLQERLGLLDEGLGNIDEELSSIKHSVQTVEGKLDQPVSISPQDIQQELKNHYTQNYTTITVSPLFEFEKEQLLKLYKIPTLFLVENDGPQSAQKDTEVKACKDIFYKNNQLHRDIYITGDAGVGKSSFCQFLCLLWSKSDNVVVNDDMQGYMDFIEKFECVFYVTLRETERIDVIAMIVDQLFFTENQNEKDKLYSGIKDIIKQNNCMVILDGLDEWRPKQSDKKDFETPRKSFSEKCVYLTTSRPYKTEHLLKHKDLVHQVKLTGITGQSSNDYIKELVTYINTKKDGENKDPVRFQKEVEECGLEDLLCIPIIASHLVAVWFEQNLTNMSRTFIYGNIVNLLFEIAEKRNVHIPSSKTSDLQLPDSLSKLNYLKNHVSLLQKVCLLSFRSQFNQDGCVATLVFTRQQLTAGPYFFNPEEIILLCRIGILSKSKVIRQFGKQEEKLSFLHLSYLEFFSALFASSFDRNNGFNDIVAKEWTSLETVLKFENFLLFLAGFSKETVCLLFKTIYPLLSDDLSMIRRNAIFHFILYYQSSYQQQLKSLQSMIISCIKESRRCSDGNNFIKLEDFNFDDNSDIDILKPLLVFNIKCVKSIYSCNGMYFSEFGKIKKLKSLHVGKIVTAHYEQFTQLISDNKSTLNTVSIEGDWVAPPTIHELPLRRPRRLLSFLPSVISRQFHRSLHHLTSVNLRNVRMEHESLHNLVEFLSSNVHFENISLSMVHCNNHNRSDCNTLTLNLHQHTNLTLLCLYDVNIVCHHVNIACLKGIELCPFSERIVYCYNDVLNCIQNSHLEYFDLNGDDMSDDNTIKTSISTIKTLSGIKHLHLQGMSLSDDVVFHPDVKHVEISLYGVTMSDQYFHSFIQNVVHISQSVEYVQLYRCQILSDDGESQREMSEEESFDYMYEYLTKEASVNITHKGFYTDGGYNGYELSFEPISVE